MAQSATPLPKELVFPATVTAKDPGGSVSPWLEYEVAEVVAKADGSLRTVAGQIWNAQLAVSGLPPVKDNDNASFYASNTAAAQRLAAAFKASGFEVVKPSENGGAYHYARAGREYWADLNVLSEGDIRFRLVMPTARPAPMKLPPPAPNTPEAVPAAAADFAFLARLPGASAPETSKPGTQFVVSAPGQPGEVLVVSQNPTVKRFARASLGNAHLIAAYQPALAAAGWAVAIVGGGDLDGWIEAHYAKSGRDLWMQIKREGWEAYSVTLADLGAVDFSQKLRAECRVPLDGVLFDFNQATLQPTSDVVLARALVAIQQNPKLALEVQGHTDAVGSDDANQKLSDARAKTVLAWLVAKGAQAGQLTARAYGKTRPIESNDTPEGRAQNRRVELACRK